MSRITNRAIAGLGTKRSSRVDLLTQPSEAARETPCHVVSFLVMSPCEAVRLEAQASRMERTGGGTILHRVPISVPAEDQQFNLLLPCMRKDREEHADTPAARRGHTSQAAGGQGVRVVRFALQRSRANGAMLQQELRGLLFANEGREEHPEADLPSRLRLRVQAGGLGHSKELS